MTPLVPLAMFGWILVTIIILQRQTPDTAVVASVILGFLFLPMAVYDVPGIPPYTKSTAISFGLILGGGLASYYKKYPIKVKSIDMPMVLWCTAVPFMSSVINALGIYDGVSGILNQTFIWSVFYWSGRRFFLEEKSVILLTWSIAVGGIIYLPFIFLELRISPILHDRIYGWFQHSWWQHVRYGGYRPIVFMQHALMVSFWMAISTVALFWIWRTRTEKKIFRIRVIWLVFAMIAATILCKSANGWAFMTLGIALYFFKKPKWRLRILRVLLFLVPFYMVTRLFNLLSTDFLERVMGLFFDDDRVVSFSVRLVQENAFGSVALQRPIFGWGGYGRGWPVNSLMERTIDVVDSLWIFTINRFGLFGLVSLYLGLGIGPWLNLKYLAANLEELDIDGPYAVSIQILSMIVIFFMIDSLINGMINPVIILCSGVLVGQAAQRLERKSILGVSSEFSQLNMERSSD